MPLSLVSPILAEQYADMHALDFRHRNTLLDSYHHDFVDLQQWDYRLANYMDGLILLANETERYLQEQLLSPLSVGDLFTIALFAVRTQNRLLLDGCMGLLQVLPQYIPAFKRLIDWLPSQSWVWEPLCAYPQLKAMVMYLRRDVGLQYRLTEQEIAYLADKKYAAPFLTYALYAQQSAHAGSITKELMLLGGEHTKIEMVDAMLRHHLEPESSKAWLFELMQSSHDDIVLRAMRLFTLHTSYTQSEYDAVIESFITDARIFIQSLGLSGYVSNIPRLIEYFEHPDYARLSAAAVTTITGSLPEECGWHLPKEQDRASPETNSADMPASDPDVSLSWPDKHAFLSWWQSHANHFTNDQIYLNGYSVSEEGLLSTLTHGSLVLRQVASERLQHSQSAYGFDSHIPAWCQQEHLLSYQLQRKAENV